MWEWRDDLTFLTAALYGNERSASRFCRFTSLETDPDTDWIGDWVGSRAGLGVVGKRIVFLPLTGIEPPFLHRLARSLVALLTYPAVSYYWFI
jgi:hypothetical protein